MKVSPNLNKRLAGILFLTNGDGDVRRQNIVECFSPHMSISLESRARPENAAGSAFAFGMVL